MVCVSFRGSIITHSLEEEGEGEGEREGGGGVSSEGEGGAPSLARETSSDWPDHVILGLPGQLSDRNGNKTILNAVVREISREHTS